MLKYVVLVAVSAAIMQRATSKAASACFCMFCLLDCTHAGLILVLCCILPQQTPTSCTASAERDAELNIIIYVRLASRGASNPTGREHGLSSPRLRSVRGGVIRDALEEEPAEHRYRHMLQVAKRDTQLSSVSTFATYVTVE